MNERIEQIISELLQVADDPRASFGELNAEQLNWKPAEKSWSVAQCFDHLITTHSLYFPLFERLEKANAVPSGWEKHSPLSRFFGRFLIKSMRPENLKKMKTTSKAEPSSSDIDGDIIERFAQHQDKLTATLKKLPADIDPTKRMITSPLLSIVTYSLDDTFTILVVHCQRHFGQAKRVTEAEGFPKSAAAV